MIVIIGAGLAGLTTALELVNNGFNVIIYEKDNIAGGMAKSKRINGIPTEHSWRGYMSFYYNTFDILKKIPYNNILEKNLHEVSEDSYLLEKLIDEEEVNNHNNTNDAWIIYKGYVYDITYFIKLHPGGFLIDYALGKNIIDIWEKYYDKLNLSV